MIQNDRNIQKPRLRKPILQRTEPSYRRGGKSKSSCNVSRSAPAKVETIVRQDKKVGGMIIAHVVWEKNINTVMVYLPDDQGILLG